MAITVNTLFQSAGFIFNLIPYHIGYLLKDHRFAILIVRLLNRFILSISIVWFSYILISSYYSEVNVVILIVILIFYQVHFPGPLSNNNNQGVSSNIKDKEYLYKYSHVNDLTRAMFCETSAPVFIFAVSNLMILYNSPNTYIIIIFAFLMQVIIYFLHLPTGIVYSYLMIVVLLNISFIWASIAVLVSILIIVLYVYYLRKDEVGTEIFAHNDGGKIFDFTFTKIKYLSIFSFQLVIILAIAYTISNNLLIMILLSSGLFYYLKIFKKHQMNRFWNRSAVIIFQLVAIVLFVSIIYEHLFNYSEILLSILGVIYFGSFIYFYSVNSLTMYQNKVFLIDEDIRKATSEIFNKKMDKLIVTDSQILGHYIYLYSFNNTLLRNYSLQNRSYIHNLELIIKNFKILGYQKNNVIELLTKNIKYTEMLERRPFIEVKELQASAKYNIQFMATYYIFNEQILKDEFYHDEFGWSKKYTSQLESIWEQIDTEKGANYQIYNFNYFQ